VSDWEDDTQTEPGEVDGQRLHAPLRRSNAYLIVITGAGVGTMYRVPPGEAIIGRGQRAEVRLIDDGVSRAHARLRVDRDGDGDKLVLEDLSSRNGTYLNGKRLERPQVLADGDKIQIGRTAVLRFCYHDSLDETFHEQMLQSALRDSSTKLFNKRYFLDRLDGELKFARRHTSALSVLMVDIDHFKQVNDRYGHVAGDAVLANVAAAIARSVRNEDVVARFGGEEIGIILRAIELDHAMLLAERLRRLIAGIATHPDRQPIIRVTVSIGCAGYPAEPFETVNELLDAADQAMYRAKRAGRDRVSR
jgi:two-component system, cell cycle response regulator